MRRFSLLTAALMASVGGGLGATDFEYRIPAVPSPTSAIQVFLDLTTARDDIASAGSRLTYDPTKVTFVSIQKGAGIPPSWSFIFQDTSTPGQVDFALTDVTTAAATINGPVADLEVVKLTFNRVGLNCAASSHGFNAAAPAPGPPTAAFPVNHYIIYVDSANNQIVTETALTAPSSGPTVTDHAFIRGNINNRAAHLLDIGDLVDLVNNLFGGFVLSFDCQAAIDVNNDSFKNIADVVALVQGVFGLTGFTIPPPNAANPGPGIPGLVVPDGGAIPSFLGCSQGETCP